MEHFTCVSEPEGNYLTHVTQDNGDYESISWELVDVIQERGLDLTVIGMDGNRVNTGIHNWVIRRTKVELGLAVQHLICLLHLNELPLWHLFCHLDGVTSGPDSFKGDLGKKLSKDVWK